MATTSDHETSPLGFDPVEVAAAAMVSDPGAVPDEHDTVITPRPETGAPAYTDDVLPPDGGRRARREAVEAKRLPLATPSPLGRWVIPIALVLIAAVGLVAGWAHYRSNADTSASGGPALPSGSVTTADDGATPAASTTPSTLPSATGPVAPSDSAGGVVPGASVSGTPAASTSPSASSKPSSKPSSTPSASATAARPIDRSVPVVVLNATSRPGLASKVAAQLRAKGWTVTSVGNWTRGGIPKTTVFLNGHLNAQATIRKDFPYATGPILMPLAAMPHLRMIVVVGDDYPR